MPRLPCGKQVPGCSEFCLRFRYLQNGWKNALNQRNQRLNQSTGVQALIMIPWDLGTKINLGCPPSHRACYIINQRYIKSIKIKLFRCFVKNEFYPCILFVNLTPDVLFTILMYYNNWCTCCLKKQWETFKKEKFMIVVIYNQFKLLTFEIFY